MTDKKPELLVESRPVENRLEGFWVANGKKVLIALAAVVVIAGGIFAYNSYVKAPAELKASEALFRAESYFRQDSLKLALNGDNINPGFLKVISKHGGTKAANLARFYAGSCYLQLGDFNNAVKQLEDFSTGSIQVKARAKGMLGDAYSELGKKEEAAAQYTEAGTMFEKDDFNSPEYLFRAGYLYENLGKNKDAIEMYKIIKEKYSRSDRGFTIDKYLARLGEISE
ncbi:MAG: tetratricopeptide repeat protein [Chitinophagaceae bacterium]|nr:tetratricopeptide repeat protein [Chitinophagaceae bacterium]